MERREETAPKLDSPGTFWFSAQTLITRRMAEIEAEVSRSGSAEGMYLTYLLSSGELTEAEVYACITELLLGGVDTVRGEAVAAARTHKDKKTETVCWKLSE